MTRHGCTDSPDPARENGDVLYTVTVANQGPGDVAATVNVPDPDGGSFGSASTSQGTVSYDGTQTTGHFGTISHGSSAHVDMVFSYDHPGTRTLTATVTPDSGDNDPNGANNSASESTTVRGLFVAPSTEFGDQPLGTLSEARTFVVTNGSADAVTIPNVLTAGDVFDFVPMTPDRCAAAPTLDPDDTCSFTLRFAPGALGDRAETRTLAPGSGTIDPLVISLTGRAAPLPSSTGPEGPQGPQGPAAFKLVVVAAQGKLSSRPGGR
jgi:hypothetical protein